MEKKTVHERRASKLPSSCGRGNYLRVCILTIHTHALSASYSSLSPVCGGGGQQCHLPVVAIQKLYVR